MALINAGHHINCLGKQQHGNTQLKRKTPGSLNASISSWNLSNQHKRTYACGIQTDYFKRTLQLRRSNILKLVYGDSHEKSTSAKANKNRCDTSHVNIVSCLTHSHKAYHGSGKNSDNSSNHSGCFPSLIKILLAEKDYGTDQYCYGSGYLKNSVSIQAKLGALYTRSKCLKEIINAVSD